jgi:hypothetical protein
MNGGAKVDIDGDELGAVLRRLLRELSSSGLTYSQMEDLIAPKGIWNANAIKQFAFRTGGARPTKRLSYLVKFVARAADEFFSDDIKSNLMEELIYINAISERSLPEPAAAPLRNASARGSNFFSSEFSRLVDSANRIRIPEKFAFVRFNAIGNKAFVVQVTTKKGSDGHLFVMKISGSHNRVVLGFVLLTTSIVTFQGIAYDVQGELTAEEFSSLDLFSISKLDNDIVSQNEIGLESFSFYLQDLPYSVIPVFFSGLDGKGSPISGKGMLVGVAQFGRFNLDEKLVTSVQCDDPDVPIIKAMKDLGCITHSVSNISATSAREKIDQLFLREMSRPVDPR